MARSVNNRPARQEFPLSRYAIENNARKYPNLWPMPSCARYTIASPPTEFRQLDYNLDPIGDNDEVDCATGLRVINSVDDEDEDLSYLDDDACVQETLGSELRKAQEHAQNLRLALCGTGTRADCDAYSPHRRTFVIGDDFDDYDGDPMDVDDSNSDSDSDEVLATFSDSPLWPPQLDVRVRPASWDVAPSDPHRDGPESPPAFHSDGDARWFGSFPPLEPPGLIKRPSVGFGGFSSPASSSSGEPRSLSCTAYVGPWRV